MDIDRAADGPVANCRRPRRSTAVTDNQARDSRRDAVNESNDDHSASTDEDGTDADAL